MGWYSAGPELRCLGTTRLLPCHEATAASTPSPCVHPAFSASTPSRAAGLCGQRSSPPRPRAHPPPEAPAPPPATCAVRKLPPRHGKGFSPLQKPRTQLLRRQPPGPRPPPARVLLVFNFKQTLKKKTNKQTTFRSRRFGLTDGEKASRASENSASGHGSRGLPAGGPGVRGLPAELCPTSSSTAPPPPPRGQEGR